MNKTNRINNNNNNNALRYLSSLAGGFGSLPRRALNFTQLGRTVYNMFTAQGRKSYKRNNNRIEISDAVGGRKSVSNTGRIQEQTINMYTQIVSTGEAYTFPLASTELNIQQLLNDSQEFLDMRKKALEYKVVQVSVNFNFSYIPLQGNRFPKMILNPETDTVLETQDPKLNRNAMVWDMTKTGNKNFNFRINKRNTEESNLEWQNGAAQWSAICILHLSSVSAPETDPNVNLGDVKISVQCLYKPVDSKLNAKNRISDQEAINEMKKLILEQRNKATLDSIQDNNYDIVDTSTKLC